MSHTHQIIDRASRSKIRSIVGEQLDNVVNLINDRLTSVLEISLDGDLLTIGSGLITSQRSDELGSTKNSFKVGIPPIAGLETKPVPSSLDFSSGLFDGDFIEANCPNMTAGDYVRMGIEFRPDRKFYAIFGTPAASLVAAGYPAFAVGASYQLLTVDLKDNGTGGQWNFIAPVESDVTVFANASAGGGGSPNAKLVEGGVWLATASWLPLEQLTNLTGSTPLFNQQATEHKVAQSFTPTSSGKILGVSLDITKGGNPVADVVFELRNISGGLPGSTVLATRTIAASQLTSGVNAIVFAEPATVVAGTAYCVTVSFTNVFTLDGANRLRWYGSTTNQFAGGDAFVDTGSGWTLQTNNDFKFTIEVSEISNILTWTDDAFVTLPGLQKARNRIAAGSVNLADGQAAYVLLNKLAGFDATLPVITDDYENIFQYDPNLFLFARGTPDSVVVGNGSFRLRADQSKELDAGLSRENRALLGDDVNETTSEPEYALRGAPLRVISEDQKILDAIASVDVEIDKFFGQLRLIPHESNPSKVRITGVDKLMKSGAILSQEIASLLMSFDGAVINLTTGDVLAADDSTPLGVNFAPETIPTSEYNWYSIGMVANSMTANGAMTAQLIVLSGGPNASEGSTNIPSFAGSKKIGLILVQNVGGTVQHKKIRQLGAGTGGGGGISNAKLVSGGTWSWSGDQIQVLDNSIVPTGYGNIFTSGAMAQSFTATGIGISYIKSSAFAKSNAGTTGTLRGYIYTAHPTTGLPDVLVAQSTNQVQIASLTVYQGFTEYPDVVFNFSGQALTPGQKYCGIVTVESVGNGQVSYLIRTGNPLPTQKCAITGSFPTGFGEMTSTGMNLITGELVAGTLGWDASAFVAMPGLYLNRNTIQPSSSPLVAGQALYVKVNTLDGAAADLTVYLDEIKDISPYDSSIFVFAVRTSTGVVVDATLFADGEKRSLDDSGTLYIQDGGTIVSSVSKNVVFLGSGTIKTGSTIRGNVIAHGNLSLEVGTHIEGNLTVAGLSTGGTLTLDATMVAVDSFFKIAGNLVAKSIGYATVQTGNFHTLTVGGSIAVRDNFSINTLNATDSVICLNIAGNVHVGGSFSAYTKTVNSSTYGFFDIGGDFIVGGSVGIYHQESFTARGFNTLIKGSLHVGGSLVYGYWEAATGYVNSNYVPGTLTVNGDISIIGNVTFYHRAPHTFYGNANIQGNLYLNSCPNASQDVQIVFYGNADIAGEVICTVPVGTTAASTLGFSVYKSFRAFAIKKTYTNYYPIIKLFGKADVKFSRVYNDTAWANKAFCFYLGSTTSVASFEVFKVTNAEVYLVNFGSTTRKFLADGYAILRRFLWQNDTTDVVVYGTDDSLYDVIVDASGKGDYTSISSAVSGASDTATIFVRNGSYSENLITLKTGQTIIGESRNGVVITTAHASYLFLTPGKYSGPNATRPATENVGFDSASGLGTITITNGSRSITYTGVTHPSDGHHTYIQGEWYLVSNVNTINKTFNVDRDIFKPTQSGLPWRLAISASPADYIANPNRRNIIENMTVILATNAYFVWSSGDCNYTFRNIDIINNYHSASREAIYLASVVNFEFDNIRYYNKNTGVGVDEPTFFIVQDIWDCRITNCEVYGTKNSRLNGSTSAMSAYRCYFHFKKWYGDGLMWLAMSFLQECVMEVEDSECRQFNQNDYIGYKCTFKLGRMTLSSSAFSLYVRGHGNEIYLGNLRNTGNGAIGFIKAGSTVVTDNKNLIVSGNVVGGGTITLDDSVILGDTVFFPSTVTVSGTPYRSPSPRMTAVVVDASGGGDALTIAAGITKAGAFGTVFVRNGNYSENTLSMLQGQKLVGESKNGVVITMLQTTGIVIQYYYALAGLSARTRATAINAWDSVNSIGLASVTLFSKVVGYSGSTNPNAGEIVYIHGEWFEVISVDTGLKQMTLNKEVRHPTSSNIPFATFLKQQSYNLAANPHMRAGIKNLTIKTGTQNGTVIDMSSQVCFDVEDVDIIDQSLTSGRGFYLYQNTDCNIRRVRMLNANTGTGTTDVIFISARYSWGCSFTELESQHAGNSDFWGETSWTAYRNKIHFISDFGSVRLMNQCSYMFNCEFKIDKSHRAAFVGNAGSGCFECMFEFGDVTYTEGGTYPNEVKGLGNVFILGAYKGKLDVRSPLGVYAPTNKLVSGHISDTLYVDAATVLGDTVSFVTLSGTPGSSPAKKMYAVVDAAGGGDYTDINAAVTALSFGATIFVKNGTYSTSIAALKQGQKLIGESREGVRLVSSGGTGIQMGGSYSPQMQSRLNSVSELWDTTAGVGLFSVTNNSTTVSYSGTGSDPYAGLFFRFLGEWYKIITADSVGNTFTVDRPVTKGVFTNVPGLIVHINNAYYDLHTYQTGGVVIKNMTILSGTQTTFTGISAGSQIGMIVDNVDIIGENASSGFYPLQLNSCMDCEYTNIRMYWKGSSAPASRMNASNGWENRFRNISVYGGSAIDLYGSVSTPMYRCKFHFKEISCVGAMFSNQALRAWWECELEVERGQAESIISSSSDGPVRCTFRFGKIRTNAQSSLRSTGCLFYFEDVECPSNIIFGKPSNHVNYTPYNKMVAGQLHGGLTVDASVVMGDTFRYTGTLTGTPVPAPFPKVYDYIVDAAGGGDFTTIQQAQSVPANKTIYIRNGSYDLLGSTQYPNPGVSIIGESKDGVRITSSAEMWNIAGYLNMKARTLLIANMTTFDAATNIGTVTVTQNSTAVVYTGDLSGAGTIIIGDVIALGSSELYPIAGIDTGTKTITLSSAYLGASGSGLPCFVANGTADRTRAHFTLKNVTLTLTGNSQCINVNQCHRVHLENITCFHGNSGAGYGFISMNNGFRNKVINVRTISTGSGGGATFSITGAWGLEFVNVECERSKYNYWGGGANLPSLYCNLHFKQIVEAPALFFLGWGGQVFGSLVIDHAESCRGGFIQDGGGTAEDLWHFYMEIKRMSNCSGQMNLYGRNMTFVGGHLHHAGIFRFKSRQGSTNNVLMSGMFTSVPVASLEVDSSTIICSAVNYPTGAISGSPKRNDGFAF